MGRAPRAGDKVEIVASPELLRKIEMVGDWDPTTGDTMVVIGETENWGDIGSKISKTLRGFGEVWFWTKKSRFSTSNYYFPKDHWRDFIRVI